MWGILNVKFVVIATMILASTVCICFDCLLLRPDMPDMKTRAAASTELGESVEQQPMQRIAHSTLTETPDWKAVAPILSAKCAGCHHAGSELPDLTSDEAVIKGETEDGEPLVVPGNPQESWLWEQVSWHDPVGPDRTQPIEPEMPPKDAEPLSGAQMALIERWILSGAQ